MASRILVSSSPARPTNGRPVSSSVRPGPSPITTRRAVVGPSPGTVFARASHRRHRWQALMRVATSARERACWMGSVAKRSALGGSKEIPGGGVSACTGDSVFGTRETGNASTGTAFSFPVSRVSCRGSSVRITASPPRSRCCFRYSTARARPSVKALLPPRRGCVRPRRAWTRAAGRLACRRVPKSLRDWS